MAMETDVILRQIYLQAMTSKKYEDFDRFIIKLKAVVGEENVALVDKQLAEAANRPASEV